MKKQFSRIFLVLGLFSSFVANGYQQFIVPRPGLLSRLFAPFLGSKRTLRDHVARQIDSTIHPEHKTIMPNSIFVFDDEGNMTRQQIDDSDQEHPAIQCFIALDSKNKKRISELFGSNKYDELKNKLASTKKYIPIESLIEREKKGAINSAKIGLAIGKLVLVASGVKDTSTYDEQAEVFIKKIEDKATPQANLQRLLKSLGKAKETPEENYAVEIEVICTEEKRIKQAIAEEISTL